MERPEIIEIAYGYGSVGELDSIAEHGRQLARAINDRNRTEARTSTLDSPRDDDYGVQLVVQYNPYSYSSVGVAPRLVRTLMKKRRHVDRIALFVHEPWIPIEDAKSVVLGAMQRAQLAALAMASDVVLATTETYQRRIARAVVGRRPVTHMPVGSNLPDARADRARARTRLGISSETLVVTQMSSSHPSRLPRHTASAVQAIARRCPTAVVLNLGADPPLLDAAGLRVVTPGRLDSHELAGLVAASDLFLSPFSDGVSTRRTSVMAALQHEVAVVSTDGHGTDSIFRITPESVRLAPCTSPETFARAAVGLAVDSDALRSLAHAGRQLFDGHFSWPVLAVRFEHLLKGMAA